MTNITATNISNIPLNKKIVQPRSLTVTQDLINDFAKATGDHQWIHVDIERAKSESPFGGPIAHGFLSASLMPVSFSEVISVDPSKQTMINYGVDNLRFLEPVLVGSEVQFAFELIERSPKKVGTLHRFKAELKNTSTSGVAMVGEFLMLLVEKS